MSLPLLPYHSISIKQGIHRPPLSHHVAGVQHPFTGGTHLLGASRLSRLRLLLLGRASPGIDLILSVNSNCRTTAVLVSNCICWLSPALRLVFVELAAPSQELTLVGRDFKFVEDSAHRTNRLAVGTIDAYFCIYEIHLFGVSGRYATYRTDFQARSILDSYTWFGDYKTQSISLFMNDESLSHLIRLFKAKL